MDKPTFALIRGLLLAKSLASERGRTKHEFSHGRKALETLFGSLAEGSTPQEQTEWHELAREAWNFLASMGLPWSWLAVELLCLFSSLKGGRFPDKAVTAWVDQPAPLVKLIFRTKPGERRGAAY